MPTRADHPWSVGTASHLAGADVWSDSGNDRHPGLGAIGIDGDVDDSRLYGVDVPALGKARADLVPGHPPRAPIAGLPIAEAQHEYVTGHGRRRPQAAHVGAALLVIE